MAEGFKYIHNTMWLPAFAKAITLVCLILVLFGQGQAYADVKVAIADGFDFPVGKPDAGGYYKARGLRLRSPTHFGEDWNGRGGGNTDLRDPIYTCANGVVTFAHNVRQGWGNVVLIRHAYRDPSDGKVKYVDSLYGHLDKIQVKVGQQVKRGDQIGTMGTNFGMYPSHLHFEIRYNLSTGMHRNSVPSNYANWADPTKFINKFRRLSREWRKVKVPTGTYKEYAGFNGL